MRTLLLSTLLLLALLSTGCLGNIRPTIDVAAITPAVPEGKLQAAALNLIELLDQEDYASVYALFNDTMKQEMSEEKIKRDWRDVVLTAGSYEKPMEFQTKNQSDHEFITVTTIFSDGFINIEIAFDQSGKIAGLHFLPVK